MDNNHYLKLIQQELDGMPDFVKEYHLYTRHSLATSYQYLTEIRRFFTWLISEGITHTKIIRTFSQVTWKN